MPKKSITLEKDAFLNYLHLTQSEAAELHGVSLSCYKRKFHEMFRPRIYWSTKKDRIRLKQAIDYPKNNKLTPELVDQFLNGTLQSTSGSGLQHSVINKKPDLVFQLQEEKKQHEEAHEQLMEQYKENQKNLHDLLSDLRNGGEYRGYPEYIEGPWTQYLSSLEHSVNAPGLIVLNKSWHIVAANDAFSILLGYTQLNLIEGVEWTSLLPSSLKTSFVDEVLTSVMVDSLDTTLTLSTKNQAMIKARITLHKYSEGFYMYIEKDCDNKTEATLSIDDGEKKFQVPCIGDEENSSVAEAVECQDSLFELLCDIAQKDPKDAHSGKDSKKNPDEQSVPSKVERTSPPSNFLNSFQEPRNSLSSMSEKPQGFQREDFCHNYSDPCDISELFGMQNGSPWQQMETW